jgi:hypothetical protein
MTTFELAYNSCFGKVAPRAGFEPATDRLTVDCSTTELPGNIAMTARAYSKCLLQLPSTKFKKHLTLSS